LLHLVLLLRQLPSENGGASPTGQRLFDRFCRDIDDNFREMGVGDLKVPKEMQKVAEAFYGRAKGLRRAHSPATILRRSKAAVARNVFGVTEPPLGARRLAAYMREASRRLSAQEPQSLARGELDFPDPDAVPP
jgi:cytochrome b pre-mRNA-processing protein 3